MEFNALQHAADYTKTRIERIKSGICMVRDRLADANNADKAVDSSDAGLYADALLLVDDALDEVYAELVGALKETGHGC